MKYNEACKILEIDVNSNEETIKDAYKKQAKKWHPDKHRFNKKKAEEKFKLITEAYETLNKATEQQLMTTSPFYMSSYDMNPFEDIINIHKMFNSHFRNVPEESYSSYSETAIHNGRRVTTQVEIKNGIRTERIYVD